MDYEKIIVIRDKVHKCSYVTLPNQKKIRIRDSGEVNEISEIPVIDPPNTSLKDQSVFRLKPHPYTGLEIPPYSVERKITQLFQEFSEGQQQKST